MGDLRYADAGVDIDEGERAVSLIKKSVASTHTPSVVGNIGAFSGLFAFDKDKYRDPVLASSTDSVGTKVKVATAVGSHRGIGADLVNHCINDIAVCGAEPLFFLDYYATGKLLPEHLAEVIDGATEACRDAGCALIGGETAEMPGLYGLSDYDIAGFVVGVLERDQIIDGHEVQAGDAVLGLPSSGLHTNGYSLVRHIVMTQELSWSQILAGTDAPLGELLLRSHRSYLPAIRELRAAVKVKALAHITGGGLLGNIPRVLPIGLGVELSRGAWEVPALFNALQSVGNIHESEMWRTFNMGVGLVAVVSAADAEVLTSVAGLEIYQLGRVVETHGQERVSLR